MTFGSLFAGIGGLDLGLERAGMTCKWQIEIDDYCQKVLAKHWPDVERFSDVREVGSHNLEPVDLICGGFPCQDISLAGKGAGLEGERSGLWWEFHRIISELRPRYVLAENVPALTFRGGPTVLGSLASLGFDAEWDHISAASVGAPHRRDRIFIVAWNTDSNNVSQVGRVPREKQTADSSRNGSGTAIWTLNSNTNSKRQFKDAQCRTELQGADDPRNSGTGDSPDVADPNRQRPYPMEDEQELEGAGEGELCPVQSRSNWRNWWATEPDVGRVAHGISSRVDRLKGLGNAVVPQVAEYVGRRIMEAFE